MRKWPRSAAGRALATAASLALLAGLVLVGLIRTAAPAQALPSGFSDTVVLSGLTEPSTMAFAPDGSIVIAEKGGRIWSYKSFSDPAPTLVADLRPEVNNYGARGLMGLALAPAYPTDNHIYVLYARDAPPGQTPPVWNDACATPPGPVTDGCIVSNRIARLTIVNGVATTPPQTLVDGWCQQFTSHSADTLSFGPDGYLYASAGEGASFQVADYGQLGGTYAGDKVNPCGDPPGGAGTALTPPTAEGGSLRAQSVRRTDGPAVLNGSVIRIDPATGNGAPGNPYAADADPNRARVLAYGFRNPFRFTVRPGTKELWVGDVGDRTYEEVDRIPDVTAGAESNFGWPCYEGPSIHDSFQVLGLNMCQSLYDTPDSTLAPYYAYRQDSTLSATDTCPSGSSALSGVAFYTGSSYPSQYRGALFFTDQVRQCLWAMLPKANGDPDPDNVVSLGNVAGPVELLAGPASMNNDLFYIDLYGGAVHRLSYPTANLPPTAVAKVTPTNGATPLTVQYDATGSTDPEHSSLAYTWAFGDGTSSTSPTGSHTYQTAGNYTAKLTVTDPQGLSDTATVAVYAGARITSMTATALTPSGTVRTGYRVGDRIRFSGAAVDSSGKAIPAANFSWQLLVHHCPTATTCHTHNGGTLNAVTTGTIVAPDHDYPCYLTVELSVNLPGTSQVLSKSVRIDPQLTKVSFASNLPTVPLVLTVDGVAKATPFSRTMVKGHVATISAATRQTISGHRYDWRSWSDGKAATHTIVVPVTATTLTANYAKIS